MKEKVGYILLRYLFLLIIALLGLNILYIIFTPLTIYPYYFLLSLVYPVSITGVNLLVNGFSISIIPACVAGSAYYLLVLLNFSMPMPVKKRISALAFSLALFLAINIFRIFIFSLLLVNSFRYFDITHLIFWYFLSGIFVFLIWLWTIRLFKIKGIPFYTDLKFLYSLTKPKTKK